VTKKRRYQRATATSMPIIDYAGFSSVFLSHLLHCGRYRLRQPYSRLTPLPEEPPRISAYLTFLETRIIGLHFAADSMGLSLFNFFWWALSVDAYLPEEHSSQSLSRSDLTRRIALGFFPNKNNNNNNNRMSNDMRSFPCPKMRAGQ